MYHKDSEPVQYVGDNESVVSELTATDTNASTHRALRRGSGLGSFTSNNTTSNANPKARIHRKSLLDVNELPMSGGNITGRNLLSGNMLDYIKDECVDNKEAMQLKKDSVDNPLCLLGWQVSLWQWQYNYGVR